MEIPVVSQKELAECAELEREVAPKLKRIEELKSNIKSCSFIMRKSN